MAYANIRHVGATEVVALIGVCGTLAAGVLAQFVQARSAERALKLAHLLEQRAALYVDAMDFAHRQRMFLSWMEDVPDLRPELRDSPARGPSAATISARMEVYAPADVRAEWGGARRCSRPAGMGPQRRRLPASNVARAQGRRGCCLDPHRD